MPAGQGVGGVRTIKPAGDIVHEMVTDAERLLSAYAPAAAPR
jgi:NAD(P)H-dependent flavin oxidoreductase YrpB (nitropropane dioxygenase family)